MQRSLTVLALCVITVAAAAVHGQQARGASGLLEIGEP